MSTVPFVPLIFAVAINASVMLAPSVMAQGKAPEKAKEKAKEEKKATPEQGTQLKVIAGPLVGHVTSDSGRIWMALPEGSRAEVRFTMRADDTAAGGAGFQVATFEPVPDAVSVGSVASASALLSNLQPDTRYRYEVTVDGKSKPAWKGSFRTASPEGTPGKFRMALTSCMKTGQPQGSWFLLLAQQPDLHLTVGDTHYADTTNPRVQLTHHLRYRKQSEFATVIRNVPTYAIWDDHDYGPNDSDGTAEGKENSLKGWKQFWANPGAGTKETPGAFFKFSRGEVDFFVVDGRYHRSPDKSADDENKRMLGDAQFAWLMEGLKASKARFKVIASGSTLDTSKGDGWKIYTFSRHRLLDSIKANGINGVLYCSGDIHRSLVRVHGESERVGYPFVEVISSGVANSGTLSFATIDFDTARKDPTVRVRIVHGDGTVRDDKTWFLSQLSAKGDGAK